MAGLVALCVSAIARDGSEGVIWYVLAVATAIALVWICATPLGRSLARLVLLVFAVGVPVAAVAERMGLLTIGGRDYRIALYATNANLLAADIVVAFFAAIAVRPRARRGLWLPVVAIAVAVTGSRTAMLALAAGAIVHVALLRRHKRLLLPWAISGITLVVVGSVLMHQGNREAARINLLDVSTTFEHRAWKTHHSDIVQIERSAAPGPSPGSRADYIRASSASSQATVLQSIGPSDEGAPYVASVYLRADYPQTVKLRTQLSEVLCLVDTRWSRCVTPPGRGNGSAYAQLRIEATAPHKAFELYAFGPQLERGAEASPYAPKGTSLLRPSVVERFVSWPEIRDELMTRAAVMRIGLGIFWDSPLFGIGAMQVASAIAEGGEGTRASHLAHAHSLWINRLAIDGLVGVLGWILIVSSTLTAITAQEATRVGPLATALLVLNSLDATFFHAGSYFATWMAVGLLWPTPARTGLRRDGAPPQATES